MTTSSTMPVLQPVRQAAAAPSATDMLQIRQRNAAMLKKLADGTDLDLPATSSAQAAIDEDEEWFVDFVYDKKSQEPDSEDDVDDMDYMVYSTVWANAEVDGVISCNMYLPTDLPPSSHGSTKQIIQQYEALKYWYQPVYTAALYAALTLLDAQLTMQDVDNEGLPHTFDVVTCAVCGLNNEGIDAVDIKQNPIIQCQLCHVAVHALCYYIEDSSIDTKKWLCGPCEYGAGNVKCRMCDQHRFVNTVITNNKIFSMPIGAMIRTTDTNGPHWTHISCSRYFGPNECWVSLRNNTPFCHPENILDHRYSHKCMYCADLEHVAGVVLDCYYSDCAAKFHASCGQLYGCRLEMYGKDNNDPLILCSKHLDLTIQQVRPNQIDVDMMDEVRVEKLSKYEKSMQRVWRNINLPEDDQNKIEELFDTVRRRLLPSAYENNKRIVKPEIVYSSSDDSGTDDDDEQMDGDTSTDDDVPIVKRVWDPVAGKMTMQVNKPVSRAAKTAAPSSSATARINQKAIGRGNKNGSASRKSKAAAQMTARMSELQASLRREAMRQKRAVRPTKPMLPKRRTSGPVAALPMRRPTVQTNASLSAQGANSAKPATPSAASTISLDPSIDLTPTDLTIEAAKRNATFIAANATILQQPVIEDADALVQYWATSIGGDVARQQNQLDRYLAGSAIPVRVIWRITRQITLQKRWPVMLRWLDDAVASGKPDYMKTAANAVYNMLLTSQAARKQLQSHAGVGASMERVVTSAAYKQDIDLNKRVKMLKTLMYGKS